MNFKNVLTPTSFFRAKSEINKKPEVSDESFQEKGSQFHQYVAGISGKYNKKGNILYSIVRLISSSC